MTSHSFEIPQLYILMEYFYMVSYQIRIRKKNINIQIEKRDEIKVKNLE